MKTLKDLRIAKGLTRAEVSDLTGLNYVHVGYLENGEMQNPHIFTFKLLSDVYEVSLDEMYEALLATINGAADELGSYLYNERKKRNLTQKELGELVGLTGAAVGRLEREGFKHTKGCTKRKIADYLGITVDELLEYSE